MTSAGSPAVGRITEFSDEVAAYGADFLGGTRGWLDTIVSAFVADGSRRNLVIVGEPGVGKSTYIAHLAERFEGPRYFTRRRRDDLGSIDDADPRTFLISIGLQLRERYPDLTRGDVELQVTGRVDADTATESARAVGVDIEEAHVSPFRRFIVEGTVDAGSLSGNADLAGVRIRRLYDSTVSMSMGVLLREAVVEPLTRLAKVAPREVVVFLVDGLDVGLNGASSDLVDVIPTADNLRVVMTSRPGAHLARFKDDERVLLSASGKATRDDDSVARNRDDVGRYVDNVLATDPVIRPAVAASDHPAEFARTLRDRSDGNFLYLRQFFIALAADLRNGDSTLLQPDGIPEGIRDFYRLMLAERVRRDVPEEAWLRRYVPVLGILAVARDGLTSDQIATFAGIEPEEVDVVIGSIAQFLDTAVVGGRAHYRIYHASFAEWLTDDTLNREYPLRPTTFHRRIVAAYGLGTEQWAVDDWRAIDGYGMQHLAAHLGAVDPDGVARLLTTYPYLEAKLSALGFGQVLHDFEYAAPILAGRDAEKTIRLLRGALRLAGQAIVRNPSELPTQLIGRLGGLSDEPLRHLVASARGSRSGPWLEPLTPSLAAPGGVFRVVLRGHEGTPRSVAITPDGRIGASAGNSTPDGTVRVWDLEEGEALFVLRDQATAGGLTPIALSGDGRLLMTAYDNEVRLWDLVSGTSAATFSQHRSPVRAVTIAERSLVAATGDAAGIVLLWDLRSRALIRELRNEPGAIRAVALTPDGRWLAVLAEASVEVWDVSGAGPARRRAIEPVLAIGWSDPVAIASDGTSVMYGDPAHVWTIATDEDRLAGRAYLGGRPLADAVDAGKILSTAPGVPGSQVFDLAAQQFWLLPDTDGTASSGALSRDGRWALVAYFDHKVVAWDIEPLSGIEDEPRTTVSVRSVAFAADSQRAAVFRTHDDHDPPAMVLDLETGEEVIEPAGRTEALDRILAEVASDAAMIAKLDADREATDSGTDADPGGDRARPSEEGLAPPVHWDFYAHDWVASSPSGLALHWLRPTAKGSEHEEDPQLAAGVFRADVVDADRHQVVVRLAGHRMPVWAGAISADGRRAATGSVGRLVRVWDLPSGDLRATLPAARDPVSAVSLSADGALLATASWDGSVRVWDVEGGRMRAVFSGDSPMGACAISPDGSRVVAGDRAGRVHVLKLRNGRD